MVGATLGEPANNTSIGMLASNIKSHRIRKAIALYSAGQAGYEAYRRLKNWRQSKIGYSVVVRGDDPIYDSLSVWLLDKLPDKDRRSVRIVNRHDQPMRLAYDADTIHEITISGHKVSVALTRPESAPSAENLSEYAVVTRSRERITFSCSGAEARDAVVDWLKERSEQAKKTERKPRMFRSATWGGWRDCMDVPQRDPDTIVLADGIMESLTNDLQLFLDSEQKYVDLGIPWHRGILLYGPPGTGKTSIGRALATHFQMDVYIANIPDMESDTALLGLIADLPPRSLLLLEDVDVLHAARERDDQKPGVTLTGFLNALDGLLTPHGMIMVMTSNNKDALDDAVLRAGRVDVQQEIGLLDEAQHQRLVRHMLNNVEPAPSLNGVPLSPADVVEAVKKNMNDPDAAMAEIGRLVRGN